MFLQLFFVTIVAGQANKTELDKNDQAVKELELVDFNEIKDVLKKDMLDGVVTKKVHKIKKLAHHGTVAASYHLDRCICHPKMGTPSTRT